MDNTDVMQNEGVSIQALMDATGTHTPKAFANLVGVATKQVLDWKDGVSLPSKSNREKIERTTGYSAQVCFVKLPEPVESAPHEANAPEPDLTPTQTENVPETGDLTPSTNQPTDDFWD